MARKRQFRPFPDQRLPLSEYYDPDPDAPDKTYCSKAAFIDGFEFDRVSHRIPKSAYNSSDIVHWLALDVALKALADAGFTTKTVPSERTGVILGNTLTGEHSRAEGLRLRWPFVSRTMRAAAREKGLPPYKVTELLKTMESYYKSVFSPVTEDTLSGALSNTIAGRICNYLDFHGGGYTVDGACSSSLIAVATAAGSLVNGDLDLAFAGGVDVSLDTFELIGFAKTAALTKSDMRVYDRRAGGFMPGEGCGFVVLKRLEDALADGDYIYSVVRGWGISSDGKGGLTAPNVIGQATAIKRAYERADLHPRELDFIEGHGTGTAIGDRVELEAISHVMGETKDLKTRNCGITSLKSIIGHTKAASGIGGFIKAVMAVNRRVIPPTANCTEPNGVFEQSAPMLYPVISGEVRCPTDKLKAGVSAMGFGGINCHVTIESGDLPSSKLAPSVEESKLLVSNQETELFVISAHSVEDLVGRARAVSQFAGGMCEGEMADLSSHLSKEIDPGLSLRAAIVAGSPEELLKSLTYLERALADGPPPHGKICTSPKQDIFIGHSSQDCRVGFLFPGQGSQKLNMAAKIIERHEWSRDLVERADVWIEEKNGMPISQHIYKTLERAAGQNQIDEWTELLKHTAIAQPAVCLSSLLWMEELARIGIRPYAAGGHSLGELTAFHAAGAFNERELLMFASHRGELMAASGDGGGIMAALACSLDTAEDILGRVSGYAVVANINCPTQVIISGESSAVERAVALAGDRGIITKVLQVSNAFHSRLISSAAERIRTYASLPDVLGSSSIRLFSSLDGKEVDAGINLRDHFAHHAVSQVDFVSLIKRMVQECDILLEVGPGRVLTDLAGKIIGNSGPVCVPIEEQPGQNSDLNVFLGNYFVHGGDINWTGLFAGRLIRPFTPSFNLAFIENPCERPFAFQGQKTEMKNLNDEHEAESILANETGIAPRALTNYISRRGSFLGAVIRADMSNAEIPEQTAVTLPHEQQEVYEDVEPETVEKHEAFHIDTGPVTDSTSDLLLRLVEKRTGFPVDSLSMELKLLDDLNLDSIKAAELIAEAATGLSVAGDVNVSRYANSTLAEVAEVLNQLKSEQEEKVGSISEQDIETGYMPWVRNFVVKPVEEGLTGYAYGESTRDWTGEKVLIISEPDDQEIIKAMQDMLTIKGAEVRTELFEHVLYQGIQGKFDYTHFITVLPRKPRKGASFIGRLGRIIDRLRALISPPRRTPSDGEATSVTYVQFGGGYFGAGEKTSDIEQCSAAALAASLHLERSDLKVRVIDFDPGVAALRLSERVVAEIGTSESYSSVGYDQELRRRIPRPVIHEPLNYRPRPIQWSYSDVILVTGGGRGITAKCALELAKATNVRMALAGSSPHPEENPDTDTGREIAETLKGFKEAGLTARYYQCDITEADAVNGLVCQVREDLGKITGLIHGSALNIPGELDKVSTRKACFEIAPKVFGAVNICRALASSPPKLIAGFSSIIGISGMVRNGWYGFSNEAMNLILSRFGDEHPGTSVISIAFSIWDDVGMGVRMGSKSYLARMGIGAIPASEGVRRFMQLLLNDPGERQVVVSSRFTGLDTFQPASYALPENSRFLENILYSCPGVEVVVRSRLSLQRDNYLADHVWRGTHLFPMVMGLEAMAQAVALVTGEYNFTSFLIENIRLERPITVNPESGEEIEIRAEVHERNKLDDRQTVHVRISAEQSGFKADHFSATFVLNADPESTAEQVELPADCLDIEPGKDLYNGKILFQGPLFQRISKIYSLDANKCVFRTVMSDSEQDTDGLRSDNAGSQWLTGDPFFRDSLLHAAQLPVSQDTCLPLKIKSIERHPFQGEQLQPLTAVAVIEDRTEQDIYATVYAVSESGQVVERLTGYVSRIMEHHEDYPSPEELACSDQNDSKIICDALKDKTKRYGLTVPEISVMRVPGIHNLTKEERHKIELPVIKKTVRRTLVNGSTLTDDVEITWLQTGKPMVGHDRNDEIDVSLSHDGDILLCIAGEGSQGCDIAPVTERSYHEWVALLGKEKESLLKEMIDEGESLNRSGAGIWAAHEALYKATGRHDLPLTILNRYGDGVIFGGCGEYMNLKVLAFPVLLSGGPERIIASVSHPEATKQWAAPGTDSAAPLFQRRESPDHEITGRLSDSIRRADELNFDIESYKAEIQSGPHGQPLFLFQFPVTFKEAANPSRTLYFTHYFAWIGKLREFMVQPIYEQLVHWFSTGKWALVTNHAETQISGEAKSGDIIEGRLWLDRVYGKDNSTLEFCFQWRKLLSNGDRELIAESKMSTTWGEVSGHGSVEVRPLPEFGLEFVRKMLPEQNDKTDHRTNSERVQRVDFGKSLYREPDGPVNESSLLKEDIYETSLEDANLVGNIYFSNYYIWQGRTRDHYLYETAPGYFNGSGKLGELRCVNCRIDHMSEAMPFDRIAVRLYRSEIFEHAVRFYFDYYRVSEDGKRRKLGYGEHEAVWYAPDKEGIWVPAALPDEMCDVLSPAGKRMGSSFPDRHEPASENRYDAIVIGAGIGGLTAAALLAKNGKRVLLTDQHSRPGGFCTSWKRKVKGRGRELQYIFDAGVHDISGLGPQGFVRRIMEELDISERIEWRRVDHEYILPEIGIKVPRNVQDYAALLIDRFPEERYGLAAFFKEIECCYHEIYDASSGTHHISRWRNLSFGEMLDTFIRDSRLKRLLSILYVYISDDPEKINALTMIPVFGYYLYGGHYPCGGTQVLSDTLTTVCRDMGVHILLNSSVSRIMVNNKCTVGVELANGEVFSAETVISTADVKRTFLELVGSDHLPEYFSKRIEILRPSNSAFMVSLGVDFIPDIQPATFVMGKDCNIGIMVPSKVDPSLAPKGHSCITLISFKTNEEASTWRRSDKDYTERKKQSGDDLISQAAQVIPGLEKHIVFRQEASPATFARYVRTTGGAIYGLDIDEWRPAIKTPVKGLYLAGAGVSVRPGVESAVYSGIAVVDAILKNDNNDHIVLQDKNPLRKKFELSNMLKLLA